MTCLLCQSTDTEELDDGRAWCGSCRVVFTPERQARLVEPEPTDEERRRDLA